MLPTTGCEDVVTCGGGGGGLPGYETVTGRVHVVRCSDRLLSNKSVYLTVYRGSLDHFALIYPADTVSLMHSLQPRAAINLKTCCVREEAPAAAGTARTHTTLRISSLNKEHLHFVIQVLNKDIDMLVDALQGGDTPQAAAAAAEAAAAAAASRRRVKYGGSCAARGAGHGQHSSSIDTIVEEDEMELLLLDDPVGPPPGLIISEL